MNTVRLDLLILKSTFSPADCERRISKKIASMNRQLPTTMLEHSVALLIDEYDKHLKLGLDPGLETFLSPLPAVVQFVHTMFKQVVMHGEIFPLGAGSLIELRGGTGAQQAIFEEISVASANDEEMGSRGRVESAFGLTEQTMMGLLRHAVENCLLPYLMRRDFGKTRVAKHMDWAKTILSDEDENLARRIFNSVNYGIPEW